MEDNPCAEILEEETGNVYVPKHGVIWLGRLGVRINDSMNLKKLTLNPNEGTADILNATSAEEAVDRILAGLDESYVHTRNQIEAHLRNTANVEWNTDWKSTW